MNDQEKENQIPATLSVPTELFENMIESSISLIKELNEKSKKQDFQMTIAESNFARDFHRYAKGLVEAQEKIEEGCHNEN